MIQTTAETHLLFPVIFHTDTSCSSPKPVRIISPGRIGLLLNHRTATSSQCIIQSIVTPSCVSMTILAGTSPRDMCSMWDNTSVDHVVASHLQCSRFHSFAAPGGSTANYWLRATSFWWDWTQQMKDKLVWRTDWRIDGSIEWMEIKKVKEWCRENERIKEEKMEKVWTK